MFCITILPNEAVDACQIQFIIQINSQKHLGDVDLQSDNSLGFCSSELFILVLYCSMTVQNPPCVVFKNTPQSLIRVCICDKCLQNPLDTENTGIRQKLLFWNFTYRSSSSSIKALIYPWSTQVFSRSHFGWLKPAWGLCGCEQTSAQLTSLSLCCQFYCTC